MPDQILEDHHNQSYDDYLCEQHERYLEMVTESGVPLWIAEMYWHAQPAGPQPEDYDNREDPQDDLPF